MKKSLQTFLITCISGGLLLSPLAEAKTKKEVSPPSTSAKKSPAPSTKKRTTRGTKSRSAKARVPKRPPGQRSPSADRYREIQQALATKGYLKSEPNGNWDKDSQDAMRRFQADQHLDESGKITSRSLMALGLGPNHSANLELPPAVPK